MTLVIFRIRSPNVTLSYITPMKVRFYGTLYQVAHVLLKCEPLASIKRSIIQSVIQSIIQSVIYCPVTVHAYFPPCNRPGKYTVCWIVYAILLAYIQDFRIFVKLIGGGRGDASTFQLGGDHIGNVPPPFCLKSGKSHVFYLLLTYIHLSACVPWMHDEPLSVI